MPTSATYASPPCPGPMTRAAVLALRTAGTLMAGCHYVITDGPTIGTTGNTSATQVQLTALSGTELSLEAKVHTTFDNTAWDGLYDIDLGTAGSIIRLTGPFNNVVSDPDADSPTVHTQFPWHAAGNNLRDNVVNDATLPGWGPAINAGGTITDNEIRNSTVDLTGRTNATSTFDRNRISNATVTLAPATSFFAQNNIDSGTVTHAGTGAASFSFQNNTMLTGSFVVNNTTTAQVTANNNVFGGTAGGYRVQVTGKITSPATISGNRLFNQGAAAQDLLVGGAATVQVTSNTITAGNMTLTGTANATVVGNSLGSTTLTSGPGVLDFQRNIVVSSTFTVGGTGIFTVQDCNISGNSTVTSVGASTRGMSINDAVAVASTITQNGTGSANVDGFTSGTGCTFRRATVNFNATSAPSPTTSYAGVTIDDGGTLTVGSHTPNNVISNGRIGENSTLNISLNGTFTASRIASGASLVATNQVTNSIIDGPISKSPVAINTGRLANAGFDNWLP